MVFQLLNGPCSCVQCLVLQVCSIILSEYSSLLVTNELLLLLFDSDPKVVLPPREVSSRLFYNTISYGV
jgi:hypothetical protein